MKVAIACDHGGFLLKMAMISHLSSDRFQIVDLGCFNENSVDYPDYAFLVSEAVASGEFTFGLLICTTGIGVSICANKVHGIRCALCTNEVMAEMSRRHNDANVLALGAKIVDEALALRIAERFFCTSFENGRHSRRVDKISNYQNKC